MFVYVYSASVLPGMLLWFVVLISQLRFRQQHQAQLAGHPFKSVLFSWVNYLTMAFLLCVLVGMYINEDTPMSLLVRMAFLAVVSVIYAMLEGHKSRH